MFNVVIKSHKDAKKKLGHLENALYEFTALPLIGEKVIIQSSNGEDFEFKVKDLEHYINNVSDSKYPICYVKLHLIEFDAID